MGKGGNEERRGVEGENSKDSKRPSGGEWVRETVGWDADGCWKGLAGTDRCRRERELARGGRREGGEGGKSEEGRLSISNL